MKRARPRTGPSKRAIADAERARRRAGLPPKTERPLGEHRPLGGEYSSAELAAMTPRTRLDAIHAMQATAEYRVRVGELVERSEVEREHAETAEVIRLTLFRVLPARLGQLLAGEVRTDHEVRAIILREVRDVVRAWRSGGVPCGEEVAE